MRLALAFVSMLGAAGIAGYVVDVGPSPVVVVTAMIGLIVFGVGIFLKRSPLCVAGLAIFLLGYALVLVASDASVLRAALFSALFLAQCELVFWLLEPAGPRLSADDVAPRVGATLLMSGGAGGLAALLMIASYVAAPGAWIALLGLVAFIGLGGVGAEALRRLR